jgi:hypothetical protein
MNKLIKYLAVFGGAVSACTDVKGTFLNEKGSFAMSWCYPSDSEIQITFSLTGNAYIGLGFGGSMYEADIVSGWVEESGNVVIKDYYSEQEGKPQEDTTLGGTNDVTVVGGSRITKRVAVGNETQTIAATELIFRRKLVTNDKYDRAISLTEPNDMIYAWANSDSNGIMYHGDNHNHIFVDFSKPNGIPDNAFGKEESGELSRELVRASYYATLSTIQSQAAGNPAVFNYPFGSVADVADEEPSSGRPLLLLSELERNVMNLEENPVCSLHFVTLPSTIEQFKHPEYYDIMTKPRTTLLGKLEKVPEGELDAAKETYLKKHPTSAAWINFSDFAMYRFVIEDVYCVGGFGNEHYIGWISPEQYLSVEL